MKKNYLVFTKLENSLLNWANELNIALFCVEDGSTLRLLWDRKSTYNNHISKEELCMHAMIFLRFLRIYWSVFEALSNTQ